MIRIALISLGFALGLALQADAGLFHHKRAKRGQCQAPNSLLSYQPPLVQTPTPQSPANRNLHATPRPKVRAHRGAAACSGPTCSN